MSPLRALTLSLCLLCTASPAFADSELVYLEANEIYTAGQYQRAAELFREVLRGMNAASPYYHRALLGLALSCEKLFDESVRRRAPQHELACEASDRYRQYLATEGSQQPALGHATQLAQSSERRLEHACSQGLAALAPKPPPPKNLSVVPWAPSTLPPQSELARVPKPELAEPPEPLGPNIWGWSLLGGSAASLTAGVLLYASAHGQLDLRDRNLVLHDGAVSKGQADLFYEQAQQYNDSAQTRAYVSYGLFAASGVLAGAALATFLWRGPSAARTQSAQALPFGLQPRPDGLSFGGVF